MDVPYTVQCTVPGTYAVNVTRIETDFGGGTPVPFDFDPAVEIPVQVNSGTAAEKNYAVSYHPNGGSGTIPIDMNRYYKGDKVTLSSGKGLVKPGFIFSGWALADGTVISSPFIMGSNDVTLFAVWTPNPVTEVPKTGDDALPFSPALLILGIAFAAAYGLKKYEFHSRNDKPI